MKNSDYIIEIQQVLRRSPYFEYLFKNAKEIVFKIKDEFILCTMDCKNGTVDMKIVNAGTAAKGEICVELEKSIFASSLTVKAVYGNKNKELAPFYAKVIKRIFAQNVNSTSPAEDREEIAYPGIFGLQEAEAIWKSTKAPVKVLKYKNAFEGYDVYISSGLTNPGMGSAPVPTEHGRAAGLGYELLVFSEPGNVVFGNELSGWVQYIIDTKNHIVQGQWLAYDQDKIPGTSLAGFIILNPIDFPDEIPVHNGFGKLNLLVGVTGGELEYIKKSDDIYGVAQKLFEAGIINCTPINRKSVM